MNITQIAAVTVVGVLVTGCFVMMIAGVMSVFGFSKRQQQIDSIRRE